MMPIHSPFVHTVVASLVHLLLGGAANQAQGQTFLTYDASLGTLPQNQCWTLGEDIDPPMGYPVGVASGDLHLSTMGFSHTGAAGGGVWWQRADAAIDFAADFAVEINVRIANAPDHSVNIDTGWPRPGYALTVFDIHGRLFWIGLGEHEVFLSNTSYGQYGSANTVTTAFNTTDAHHTYRLERAAGGVGAAVRIDGVLRLELPALGGAENTGALLYFGDPTYWANSESYTAWVRFTGVTHATCPGDTDCSGSVNIDDLVTVIVNWGQGAGNPGDVTGNGVVDIDDLVKVIIGWGRCD